MARRPLEREQVHLAGGRRPTQLMRDPLGGNVRSRLVCATIIAVACHSRHAPVEQLLAWADKADPAQMFDTAVETSQFQFLAVCGYSCETPGIGVITYSRCYQGIAKVHTVDPTGDVIESPEHGRLKEKAAQIAQAYNTRMIAWLDSAGKRMCPAGERWDDLWRAMIALGDRPQHAFGVGASVEPSNGSDFSLQLDSLGDLTAGLRDHLCSLPPLFGIKMPIRFEVTTGDINHHPTEHPALVCAKGKVAA